jgi:crotonobetainyl-CoA:carnitine CoA-transferase CaiB-like acyl-CoA transferase
MRLGDLGAEVIKVETVQNYDQSRGPATSYDYRVYPTDRSRGLPFNQSGWFNKPNRSKLGITLDFNHEAGIAALKALVKVSDVVIENFSARVLAKHGLDYQALAAIRPDIILVSMPAFGFWGPERDYRAYGSSLELLSGHALMRGYCDGAPVRSALNYGDPVAGLTAAGAVLAALHQRAETGLGQHVEIAQLEALVALLGEYVVDYARTGILPAQTGNRRPDMAPHGVYPCRGEESWIAIAVRSERQWQALCTAIGRPELATDSRFTGLAARKVNEDALDSIVEGATRERKADELFHMLARAGVPAGPALSSEGLFQDPQLLARAYFVQLDHAATGSHLYPGTPALLSRTPVAIRRPAPLLGEQNRQVLGQLLGVSDAEMDRLEALHVIGTEPTADVWAAR